MDSANLVTRLVTNAMVVVKAHAKNVVLKMHTKYYFCMMVSARLLVQVVSLETKTSKNASLVITLAAAVQVLQLLNVCRVLRGLLDLVLHLVHVWQIVLKVSLVNHLMEHVLVVSHHANIATLLSLLNAPAARWANSFTCINAFLPNSVLQAHMRILRQGYVKIAQLDVPLAVLPLV